MQTYTKSEHLIYKNLHKSDYSIHAHLHSPLFPEHLLFHQAAISNFIHAFRGLYEKSVPHCFTLQSVSL